MPALRDIKIGRRAVAAAVAVLVAAMPLLVTDRYLLKVLTFVGINVIIVTGMSLLFGYAGQVSLGHAAFFGLGAYSSAALSMAGWPWPAALVAGILVAAVGGVALALPTLRLRGHYLAMATLGFGQIMYVLFVEAKGITGGVDGLYGIPPISIGPYQLQAPAASYLLVWAFAGLALLLAVNVVVLRPGRALRALHTSEPGAQACGINTVRIKTQVFVISAGLAGLAGVLYAHYVGFISPSSFTLNLSILLVAMVVLGGMRSIAGAVAGAVLLTLIPYLDAIFPGLSRETVAALQDWETDIYGVTLIAVMLFMPGGLAGGARAIAGRLRASFGRGEPAEEGGAG